jgi:DNA-binding response OmpR family regulator
VKVLLIEDDPKTVRALANGLRGEGFEPVTAKTGEEGFFLVSRESFDVVILDWMLPGRDGIEVLRTLRGGGSKTPVLLLTARDAVEDRVLGLNAGADDYLVKPFAFAVAIHQHMTHEEPRIMFFHYWGRGTAKDLAQAIKGGFLIGGLLGVSSPLQN